MKEDSLNTVKARNKLTILYDENFLKQLNNFNENSFNENNLMKTDLTNSYPNLYPMRSETFNKSVPYSLTQNAKNADSDAAENPLQSKGKQRKTIRASKMATLTI